MRQKKALSLVSAWYAFDLALQEVMVTGLCATDSRWQNSDDIDDFNQLKTWPFNSQTYVPTYC